MVERPESIIVQVEKIHLNSIFSKLILNAKDALGEQEGESREPREKE